MTAYDWNLSQRLELEGKGGNLLPKQKTTYTGQVYSNVQYAVTVAREGIHCASNGILRIIYSRP